MDQGHESRHFLY